MAKAPDVYLTVGLVQTPVKVYLASKDERATLHMVHANCQNRLEYQKHCPACQRTVEGAEIVKAFDDGDELVSLSDEDLAELKSHDKNIEVVEFVRAGSVGDRWLNGKTYFLGLPAGAPDDAYRLLFDAMAVAKVEAIAQFARNGKTRMAVVRADVGLDLLVLQTLFFADELRSAEEVRGPGQKSPTAPAIALAKKLIAQMTSKQLNLERYHDDYSEAVRAMVRARRKGVEAPKQAPALIDLMTALKSSLETAGTKLAAG